MTRRGPRWRQGPGGIVGTMFRMLLILSGWSSESCELCSFEFESELDLTLDRMFFERAE